MSDINEALDFYLANLQDGGDEAMFFNLKDLGRSALPRLMDEAQKPENRPNRAFLVHVIWQMRDPSSVDFLGACLADPDANVWKEALDGLVTIGGPAATSWIVRTRGELRQGTVASDMKDEWLVEALDQMRDRQS
jgi:hypothetical protein